VDHNQDMTLLLTLVAQAFSLILPIFFSGLTLILCMKRGWLQRLDVPLDGGLKLAGQPLIGKSKSLRSLVVYLAVATAVTLLLNRSLESTNLVSPVYRNNPFLLGPLITLSYLTGEVLNSFVKRRLGIISSGQAGSKFASLIQSFFDNADGILVCGLLFTYFRVSQEVLWTAFVLAFLIHLSTDKLMRRLRLKRQK
jgi:hypothetical protein